MFEDIVTENNCNAGSVIDYYIANDQTMPCDLIINFDYHTTHQMIGGSTVAGEIHFGDFKFDDMHGTSQLWSGGIQHFTLEDDSGIKIEFSKDIDGNIIDFKIDGLLRGI